MSNCIPSTTSFSTPNDCPSSMVITPSFPTDSMASAIILPISLSLAEIEATCAISSLVLTGLLISFNLATISFTFFSILTRSSIGLTPELTIFNPSVIIACAKIVAVVVPSPATSLVLLATSFTISAPIFSNLSSSSISLATVTPSFVIVGPPKPLSITTFRPLGPRVTLTALVKISTPFFKAALAFSSNIICLDIIVSNWVIR